MQEDGRTWFGAHIVDSEAVKKVKAKVYKGFSIGGKITGRDSVDKSTITGIKLVEVSLVDRPANPEAVFTMFKAEMGEAAEDANDWTEDTPSDEAPLTEADIEIQAIAEISRRVKVAEVDKAWPDELNKVEARHREKIDQLEALHKTRVEQLEKNASEALLKLAEVQTEKDTLARRVAMLEALPEPPRIKLKAISKAEDSEGFEPLVTPVRKGDGSVDEVATEIKKIQRLNGKRIQG